jgi:hypothetical protein
MQSGLNGHLPPLSPPIGGAPSGSARPEAPRPDMPRTDDPHQGPSGLTAPPTWTPGGGVPVREAGEAQEPSGLPPRPDQDR